MCRKYESLKEKAVSMQSMIVLNSMYCSRLREQLAAQEEARKRVSKARLMGDGMPKLLTSEDFVKRVEDFANEAEKQEKAHKARKASQEEVAKARKEWEVLNEARKKENEKIRELWRADKQIWEQNKKRGVKQAPHPRLKDLTLPPIPKPAILQSTSKSKSKASGSVQAQEESDSNITGSDDGSEEEATGDSGAE